MVCKLFEISVTGCQVRPLVSVMENVPELAKGLKSYDEVEEKIVITRQDLAVQKQLEDAHFSCFLRVHDPLRCGSFIRRERA